MSAKVIDLGGDVFGSSAVKTAQIERRGVSLSTRSSSRSALRRRKAWEFWGYFVATYPLFLAIAVVSRLLPRSWRPFGAERRNVFREAKAAAYTVLPYVFKG